MTVAVLARESLCLGLARQNPRPSWRPFLLEDLEELELVLGQDLLQTLIVIERLWPFRRHSYAVPRCYP